LEKICGASSSCPWRQGLFRATDVGYPTHTVSDATSSPAKDRRSPPTIWVCVCAWVWVWVCIHTYIYIYMPWEEARSFLLLIADQLINASTSRFLSTTDHLPTFHFPDRSVVSNHSTCRVTRPTYFKNLLLCCISRFSECRVAGGLISVP
jgi:hypothetical protein